MALPRDAAIVILTGAGISAESGLRTFRDADGLWENHRVEEVATPEAFHRDPALVHRFYNDRRQSLATGQPTAAHLALARLRRAWAGAVWRTIGWGPQPMSQMPRSLVTRPDAPGHLFVGTTYGDVWHTVDYGDSWQRLPFDLGGGLSLLVL